MEDAFDSSSIAVPYYGSDGSRKGLFVLTENMLQALGIFKSSFLTEREKIGMEDQYVPTMEELVLALKHQYGFTFTKDSVDAAKKKEDDAKAHPLEKSSGIDGDSGDWTEKGDGTDYPADKVE